MRCHKTSHLDLEHLGDSNDMSLDEIKKCPKASAQLYKPTRRSKRKASINITVEEMTEVNLTLQRLLQQKEFTLTLERSIQDYNELITKQHNLNLPPQAFFSANSGVDSTTGASLEYPQLKLGDNAKNWIKGCSNEIGRLARGVHLEMMTGSNTIHFIHPSQKTFRSSRYIYLRIVASYRPQKEDPYRIRFTVGGNRIEYPGNVATPTAELQTVKPC